MRPPLVGLTKRRAWSRSKKQRHVETHYTPVGTPCHTCSDSPFARLEATAAATPAHPRRHRCLPNTPGPLGLVSAVGIGTGCQQRATLSYHLVLVAPPSFPQSTNLPVSQSTNLPPPDHPPIASLVERCYNGATGMETSQQGQGKRRIQRRVGLREPKILRDVRPLRAG